MSNKNQPAARIPQKQAMVGYKNPPKATQFKPGQSGNPGGNYKRTPKVSNAYARLLALTPEELDVFQPANGAEQIALKQINNARDGKPHDTLAAVKEVTDRTEGRTRQTVHIDNTSDVEKLVIRIQERALAQLGLEVSREEAIAKIIAYRPELGTAFE
jgi:hypothetical protein